VLGGQVKGEERGMNQIVAVVLVDRHEVFVEGIGVLLDAQSDLRVVAVAGDARQAVQALRAQRPDVLVLGTDLPKEEVGDILRAAGEVGTRSLALAEDTAPEAVARLRRGRAGEGAADAVASRQVSVQQLANAIRALARGNAPPTAALAPPRRAAHRDGHVDLLVRSLSRREREILSLLVSGYSNRRIAEECVLSLNTVRAHVQSVLIKLGVHSKLEAATFAMREGVGI
jgi:two-component system, NarL family, nitrate/nitrite response regulator NarL